MYAGYIRVMPYLREIQLHAGKTWLFLFLVFLLAVVILAGIP